MSPGDSEGFTKVITCERRQRSRLIGYESFLCLGSVCSVAPKSMLRGSIHRKNDPKTWIILLGGGKVNRLELGLD